MKAWLLPSTDGPDSYILGDIPEPEPGPGEVVVGLEVSGLNHLDLWVSRGLPAPKQMPHVGGADGAGVVAAVGEGVYGFAVGDEVIIDPSLSCGRCRECVTGQNVYCDSFQILGEHVPGTLTERIAVPARSLVRKPEAMTWEVAGSFGMATGTALRMLERARLREGETVLVVGVGGGVSSAAMHLAVGLRANVYVTSRSPSKIESALGAGAVAGFDSEGDFGSEMAAAGGADVVVDNVGPATFRQSIKAARKGGRIAVCGATSGPKLELTVPHLFFRQVEIIGSSMASRSQFARATHLVGSGQARSPVDRVFDFDELPSALALLDAGDQMGKLAIRH